MKSKKRVPEMDWKESSELIKKLAREMRAAVENEQCSTTHKTVKGTEKQPSTP
jgi:hypothetical protein